mgnify:CR=1 FL=1
MNRTCIESRHNPLLTHLKKLLTSHSYREKCGQFAAEGTKLLEEAAKWYSGLDTVIVQRGVEICALPEHVHVVEVSESIMRGVSQMDAPQGAAFICSRCTGTAGEHSARRNSGPRKPWHDFAHGRCTLCSGCAAGRLRRRV